MAKGKPKPKPKLRLYDLLRPRVGGLWRVAAICLATSEKEAREIFRDNMRTKKDDRVILAPQWKPTIEELQGLEVPFKEYPSQGDYL